MARPGHIILCPDDCKLRHNSTLLALAKCSDNKYFDDCGLLKTALYNKLKEGWNPHTAIDDPKPEFCYPLIHWACALGKAEALQWLIKMKLKPSMQCQKTGEYPLHLAIKMLYHIRRVEHMPVDRICNRFDFILKVVTDHEPHVLLLKDLKGNSVFHTCVLKIVEQEGVSSELEFYENCLKLLMNCLQRTSDLKVWNKNADTNCQSIFSTALNSQNNEGNTVLHILVQNDISYNSVAYLAETYSNYLKKHIKNSENLTPAEVALKSGAERIVTSLGICPESRTDNLHLKLPSVFQLCTQDEGDPNELKEGEDSRTDLNGFAHCTETTHQVICSTDNTVDGKDSYPKERNVRLTTRVQREGFYCVGISEDLISCDSDSSADAGLQQNPESSPSVLSCVSYSFPETQSSTKSAKPDDENDELSTEKHEPQNNDELRLDSLSFQWESDVTEDELLSLEEEVKVLATVSSSSVCGGIITMTTTQQTESPASNSLSSTRPNVTSEKASSDSVTASCLNGRMNEKTSASRTPARLPTTTYNDINHTSDIKPALHVLNGQERSTPIPSALQEDDGMDPSELNSPLVRFIKEEFDVASLIRAKLMDRKEKSRSELCELEQFFRQQEQKENEENNQLQRMLTELETLKVAREKNEESKKKLAQELKVIEDESFAMEIRCGELEGLIAQHTQRKEDLLNDKQNLNRKRAVVKRKVEDYDNALMEISSTVESSKRPKHEPLEQR